jgi:hypothetical protein
MSFPVQWISRSEWIAKFEGMKLLKEGLIGNANAVSTNAYCANGILRANRGSAKADLRHARFAKSLVGEAANIPMPRRPN